MSVELTCRFLIDTEKQCSFYLCVISVILALLVYIVQ